MGAQGVGLAGMVGWEAVALGPVEKVEEAEEVVATGVAVEVREVFREEVEVRLEPELGWQAGRQGGV